MMNREQQIRQRAYAIWEAEGQPAGCEDEHWHRAAREIGDGGEDRAPIPDLEAGADPVAALAPEAEQASASEAHAAVTSAPAAAAPIPVPPPARATKAKRPAAPRAPKSKSGKV